MQHQHTWVSTSALSESSVPSDAHKDRMQNRASVAIVKGSGGTGSGIAGGIGATNATKDKIRSDQLSAFSSEEPRLCLLDINTYASSSLFPSTLFACWMEATLLCRADVAHISLILCFRPQSSILIPPPPSISFFILC